MLNSSLNDDRYYSGQSPNAALPLPFLTCYLSVSIVSEQESKNSNSVCFDGEEKRIVGNFSDVERKSLISASNWFFANSGLSIDGVSAADAQEMKFTGCCHHRGTASFEDDRSCNVLDKNLKTYDDGNDNIYETVRCCLIHHMLTPVLL